MICKNGHEMEIQNVETYPAHQGWGQDGSGIIDATWEDMWVCTDKDCDETEPIISHEEE